jgi:hypothetical protein
LLTLLFKLLLTPLLLLLLARASCAGCIAELQWSRVSCKGAPAAALAPACLLLASELPMLLLLILVLLLLLLPLGVVLLLLLLLLLLPCVMWRGGSTGILLPLPSLSPLLHDCSLQLLVNKGHTPPFERRVAPCTCTAVIMLVMLRKGDCQVPADTWHAIRVS